MGKSKTPDEYLAECRRLAYQRRHAVSIANRKAWDRARHRLLKADLRASFALGRLEVDYRLWADVVASKGYADRRRLPGRNGVSDGWTKPPPRSEDG